MDIGPGPIAVHWPHVGSAYRGLVVVGQAVYGWGDAFPATQFRMKRGRDEAIQACRTRVDRPEPMDWIEAHPVRNSPFWQAVRHIVETLEPDAAAPWFARFAWVNLYPAAPADPKGNPIGALKEAEDPYVGALLRSTVDVLNARRVIALGGPYWWHAAEGAGLSSLPELPRPLLRGGRSEGRTWVVGWHPTGASRRHWGPHAYAGKIAEAVGTIEDPAG